MLLRQDVPVDDELLGMVRSGDYTGTRSWLVAAAPGDLTRVASSVARLRRLYLDEPEGAVGPQWEGEVGAHHDAATLAHLACLPPAKAAALGAVPHQVAADIPLIHPGHLDVFVDTWSTLFQRNPKNWDRNAHYGVIFAWVCQGLVPAPTQDGAVNLWLQRAVWLVDPPEAPGPGEPDLPLLPTPQDCPDLYRVTLPRIFEAATGKGLGAAAIDHTSTDLVIDLVRHLVQTGVWELGETLTRVDAALMAREEAFQRQWLARLRTRLQQGGQVEPATLRPERRAGNTPRP